jgi:predicted O-methyltransferase YrrM
MQVLAPLSMTYLPWTPAAMRPSGVVAVLNEIVVNRRNRIVELGAGVSTFYMARLLRQRGGHVWTVEHDDRWADLVDRGLAEEGLTDVVTLIRAPLTPTALAWPGEEGRWYDRDVVRAGCAGRSIDLLVVDGPPADRPGRRHSRYPAIAFFTPLLADDYAIILDDISRPGEQELMDCWERELGIAFERRLVNGRIGIGRPGPAFTV